MNLTEDHKNKLRQWLRAELKNLSEEDRKNFSDAACGRLQQQTVWQSAKTMLLFSPLENEVDIRPLIEAALRSEKRVCLPRFDDAAEEYTVVEIANLQTDLHPGKYGISEPASHCKAFTGKQLDFVLVPGLGFDVFGRRLGRGKGHYDRLLKKLDGVRCGLAFDCQVCSEIPVAPHDETVNYLLTPTRWLAI